MIPPVIWTISGILLLVLVSLKVICKLTIGWCRSNTCLVGKTVIITGGNSGLGYETALALAAHGAKVIIADVADTRRTINKIIEETNNHNVKGKLLDLASLESVRKFAEEMYVEESQLDILINNAGVAGLPLSYTKDGLQIHMQVNYFGHFLLTHLLLDLMKPKSRIIFISSVAAFLNNLTLDNLNKPTVFKFDAKTHNTIYSNSKLCEIIASNTFAEKLKHYGITCNSVNPGCVITPIFANAVHPNLYKWNKILIYYFLLIIGKSAYEGSQTQVNCAIAKDLQNVTGEFFFDCRPFYQPSLAKNREFCTEIWKKSEDLVNLKPEEKLDNKTYLRT